MGLFGRKPTPEEQEKLIEAKALSAAIQQEKEFEMFENGDEINIERLHVLSEQKHVVDKFLRSNGIDPS